MAALSRTEMILESNRSGLNDILAHATLAA